MPDFLLTKTIRKQPIDIGYIEAKDIGVSLDKTEKSNQMKRYLASLDNLILTDYIEFRFFREQQKVATIAIAEVKDGTLQPIPENFAKLEALLHDFVEYTGQTIKSAKTLAQMMARKAQLMRDVFEQALEDETSSLHDQLKAFQQILIHDMDAAQFADVYAQTIAYGLFTARLHDQTLEDFSRAEARELIPRSNPFLRKLFDYVCGADLDHRVVWIVDALCEVYRAANVHDILKSFGKQSGRNDPIVHFYETFLAEYDPKLRKTRGVWYTPEPVVNYIVRAVDEVLQTHFGLADGIADTSKVTIEVDDYGQDKRRKDNKAKKKEEVHRVQLLDVAAGTGTFTAEAIKQIYHKVQAMGMAGQWSQYVENHLLPRLHGFEILMASYAMCHLKIDMLLTELGYKASNPNNPPRLGVYLTNALEEHHPETGTLFASWLAAEANEANRIKRDMPIMVAYGNPPYSVSSQNKGDYIQALTAAYKKDLNERNINPLSDDYIKFIRYAEHYIEKTGSGVVAMITNNSYLDGIIHRQMRKHLLQTFDHVYIVDLHGSSKKKETTPDGSPDKNVFDIMQGVSIAVMVKDSSRKGKLANVWHQDYYGSRKAKYERLWQETTQQKRFEKLEYKEPYYFFVPKDFEAEKKYNKGYSVSKLFGQQGSGIQTKRDKLFVNIDKNELSENINQLLDNDWNADFIEEYNIRDSSSYKLIEKASKAIFDIKNITLVDYRPFDNLWIYYDATLLGRAFYNTMQHLLNRDNLALTLVKQLSITEYSHAFCTNKITDLNSVLLNSKEQTYCFPLYLYPDESEVQGSLNINHSPLVGESESANAVPHDQVGGKSAHSIPPTASARASATPPQGGSAPKRRPNLDETIVAEISAKLGLPFVPDHDPDVIASHLAKQSSDGSPRHSVPRDDEKSYFTPLDLLDYIYAVLHSPSYRETYKEFLKIDFPRIPYPENAETFWQLVALGGQLRAFHLLEHPALANPITTFPESGDCVVDKIGKASYKDGRVYINAEQYFDGVPEVAWNFYIGGYQPAQKWLKDRKGRELSFDDIRHYQKIIVALVNTDRLMKEIDEMWKP